MYIIPNLIEEFASSFSYSSTVVSSVITGGNTELNLGNTYHARTGTIVDIDGTSAEVVSFDSVLNNIEVVGEFNSPLLVTVPNPFFFHGTPYKTNTHISYLDAGQKFPMIYLYEIIEEELQNEESSGLYEIAELRLFFLDNANFAEWTTDQHYSEVITGQRKAAEEFKNKLNVYRLFDRPSFIKILNHANFGQFFDLKGHLQSIFNEYTSGVEMRLKLPIRKCCN